MHDAIHARHYGPTMGRPSRARKRRVCADCGRRYLVPLARHALILRAWTCARCDRRSAVRAMGYAWDTGDAALFFGALRECCCVRLDGCWEWGGSRNGGGYALWRGTLLHRRVVEMRENARLGTQPVHHRCGHTWCVCPDHVEPVTVAENTAEMLARRAFVTRIDELTAALREVDPENEALSRVRYGVDSDRVGE